jgi:hypothetical protein
MGKEALEQLDDEQLPEDGGFVSLDGFVEGMDPAPAPVDDLLELGESVESEPEGLTDAQQVEETTRFELLRREAYRAISKPIVGGLTLEQLWEQSGRRYLGDHWESEPREGFVHETINKIMGVVITHTSAEVAYSPRARFTPVESSDEPRAVFFKPSGARSLMRKTKGGTLLEGIVLTARQLACLDPITMEQYEMLIGLDSPTPGILTSDAFDLVNDKMLSKFAQDLYDLQWRRADGDAIWTENAVIKNGLGSAPVLCEWNKAKHNVVLSNPHIKNVWIDPLARRVEDARYMGFDQVLTVAEAKRLYPQHAELIDKVGSTGSINTTGEVPMGDPYTSTYFERPMVVLRTVWERDHTRPLTEREAIEAGKAKFVPVSMKEAMAEGAVSMTPPMPGMPMQPAVMAVDGSPANPQHPAWPTRLEPDLDSPAWPGTEAIKETCVLVDIQRVIRQQTCPYWDIPMAMPINIPLLYSAYGLGEPARLEDVQQLANRLATAISNLIRAGAYPQEYMPKELVEELEAAGISPHSSPNNIIAIDSVNWQTYFGSRGKMGFAVDAPPVNETFIRLMDMFMRLVDELGGNAAVLQGRAPSGTSGEAIDTLTNNARGPLALKSDYAEKALARVARLVLDMALKYVPDSVISTHFTSYPPGLLAYVKNTVASMEFDVNVELASGKGATKRENEQKATERLQTGVISIETAQEEMGLNVDLERQRLKSQREEQAKAAQQAAQQAQPGVPAGM